MRQQQPTIDRRGYAGVVRVTRRERIYATAFGLTLAAAFLALAYWLGVPFVAGVLFGVLAAGFGWAEAYRGRMQAEANLRRVEGDLDAEKAASGAFLFKLTEVAGQCERRRIERDEARLDAEYAAMMLAVVEAHRDIAQTALRGELMRQVRAEELQPLEAVRGEVLAFERPAK